MAETDTNSIQYICYTPCAALEFHKHIKNIAVADVPRQGSTRDLPLSDCTLSMSPIDKQFLLGLPHSAVSNGYKEEEWMPNKTPHPTGISSTNSNQQRPCRAGGWAQRSMEN